VHKMSKGSTDGKFEIILGEKFVYSTICLANPFPDITNYMC
jgi:hypothetical protein